MATIAQNRLTGAIANRITPFVPLPDGPDGQKLVALIRDTNRHFQIWFSATTAGQLARAPLDFDSIEMDLREYALTEGLDFDATLHAAAVHFESNTIARDSSPLSDEQLENLLDDDERAFGRGVS